MYQIDHLGIKVPKAAAGFLFGDKDLSYFDSWEDGIHIINKALRENYMNCGATDVWSIGPIYAESKTWSVRVNSIMNEINEEFLRLSKLSVLPNI